MRPADDAGTLMIDSTSLLLVAGPQGAPDQSGQHDGAKNADQHGDADELRLVFVQADHCGDGGECHSLHGDQLGSR